MFTGILISYIGLDVGNLLVGSTIGLQPMHFQYLSTGR